MIHLRVYMLVLVILVSLTIGAYTHAGRRQAAAVNRDIAGELAKILPSPDTGIDNSSRYIRHLGLSTFQSAFPDFPGQIDYLPEGMTWPPPEILISRKLDSE